MEMQMSKIAQLVSANDFTATLWDDGTVSIDGKGVQNKRVSAKKIECWTKVKKLAAGESGGLAALFEDGSVQVSGLARYDKWAKEIAAWNDICDIALSSGCFAAVDAQGQVHAVFTDADAENEITQWTNIEKVRLYGNFAVGIQKDGHVVTTAYSARNFWLAEIADWQDIVDAAIGMQDSISGSSVYVAGLKRDGSVVCAAKYPLFEKEIEAWTQIDSLYGGLRFALLGLKKDGSIIAYHSHEGEAEQFAQYADVMHMTAAEDFAVIHSGEELVCLGDAEYAGTLTQRPSKAQEFARIKQRRAKRGKLVSYITAGASLLFIALIWITGALKYYVVTMPSGAVIASAPVFFTAVILIVCAVILSLAWPDDEKGKTKK